MNGRQSSIACGVTRTNHILRRLSTLGLFGCGASSVHGATSSNNNNNNNNSNKVNGFVEFALALRQSTNQMDENASHAALHQLVTGSQSVTLILNSTRSLSKGYQLSTDRTSKRTNSSSNNNNSVRIAKNTSRRLYRRSRQPRLGQTKPTSPYVRRLVPHCFLRLGLGCTRRLGGHKSGHRRSKKRADIQRETGRVAAKQTHTYLSASRNADYSMSGLMDITPTLNTSVIAANTPLSSKTRQSDKAQRLPVEIVVAILSRLHRPKDIRVAQLTCRLWYDSAKTALANLRRRFPYAGMSILESLRTCINGMPRPSAHDATFRRMVSKLGSDYVMCNPDVVTAFYPIDPLDFIHPLIWTFLFIDREHHGLLMNNNNSNNNNNTATTIHHITTHVQPTSYISQVFRLPSFLTRSFSSSTSNPNEHTLNCRYFVRLVRKEYPCGHGLDKQALKAVYQDIQQTSLFSPLMTQTPLDSTLLQRTNSHNHTGNQRGLSEGNDTQLNLSTRQLLRRLRIFRRMRHSHSRGNSNASHVPQPVVSTIDPSVLPLPTISV